MSGLGFYLTKVRQVTIYSTFKASLNQVKALYSLFCTGFVLVLFLLLYVFRNEIAEIISFAIFLKFILLLILVTSFANAEGDYRASMVTVWSKSVQLWS